MIALVVTGAPLTRHAHRGVALATLTEAGVRLVDPRTGEPWSGEPLEPGTGDTVAAAFDWRWVL